MNLTPLASTTIHSVGYNPEDKLLQIAFHSGGIYIYKEVLTEVYEGLLQADSPGKYYNNHIKGNYPSRKLD